MKNLLSLVFALLMINNLDAQCGVDIPMDTATVYFGYSPMACTDLVTVPTGTPPFQYLWSSGDTVDMINVCDTASSWYYVTLTDSTACSWTDSVLVNVVDVRCGNNPNNQKVLVCHVPPGNPANEHTICISENAVSAHLAHGCYLGTCDSDTVMFAPTPVAFQLAIRPNPFSNNGWVTITSTRTQYFDLVVYDQTGRSVLSVDNIAVEGDIPNEIPLSVTEQESELTMLWIRVTSQDGEQVTKPVIVEH